MCGIIGAVVNTEPTKVKERLYHIFVSQAHRGSDGAGVTILRKGQILRRRLKCPLELFDNKMILKRKDIILFHHRYPTSTPNEEKYNHPFNDERDNLSLIHNGHISNYERLYKTLKKQGHMFESENTDYNLNNYNYSGSYYKQSKITDSEVIVHLIEGRKPEKAINVMNSNLKGNYALAWVYEDKSEIYLYRKDNPIVTYEDYEGNQYFSSEYPNNPFLEGYITTGNKLPERVLFTLGKKGLNKISTIKIKEKRNKPIHFSNERWVMEGGFTEDELNEWERQIIGNGGEIIERGF